MYEPECARLAKFSKRLMPLLEDIEDGADTIQAFPLTRGLKSMKVWGGARPCTHPTAPR